MMQGNMLAQGPGRSIESIKTSGYIWVHSKLALFDARPAWDLLKTALNSDLRARDGRAAAGAIVRAL